MVGTSYAQNMRKIFMAISFPLSSFENNWLVAAADTDRSNKEVSFR